VRYGAVREDQMGVFAAEGAVTISWNAPPSAFPLFSLVLRAGRGAEPDAGRELTPDHGRGLHDER